MDFSVCISVRNGGAFPILSNVPILLWDHILTLPDEVQLIWKARLSIAKVLFLFNRYAVPFAMIVVSHEFSGVTPYRSLSVWYAIGVTVGMMSIATSNFLILLRLWVLWDRSPRLILGTLLFYVVTQLVSLGCVGYVINDMLPTLFFDPILRICLPNSKPKFVMLWTPGMAFELMVFLTAVWNALDRPRSQNVRMTKIMYRDGSLYFFSLFALRLLNVLMCVLAPASLTFLGLFFVWSISNITLARLILNLRRLSTDAGHKKGVIKDDETLDDDVKEGVEGTELPVLRRECSKSAQSDSQDPPA
ncbi:hypothetical protein OG21DRAFT_1482863 [Imleria badia]|nr:hypothetical protein OG21DRAFT_1482863 [Imleria badia]